MNEKKFFEMAKEAGIEECQIQVFWSSSTSYKIYHHELEKSRIAESEAIMAVGIYHGKLGTGTSNQLSKDTFPYLIEEIKKTATYNEQEDALPLFPGSDHYARGSLFNKELLTIPSSEKLKTLFELEKGIYQADPRVVDTEGVSYTEGSAKALFANSKGLHLVRRANSYSFTAGAITKQGEETKTNYEYFFENDFSKFDVHAFAKKIVDGAIHKFGAKPIPSGEYPIVLQKEIAAEFVHTLVGSAIAEDVQKKSSFLMGKLHEKVAAPCVSISEKPLAKNLFFSPFDDEGVASINKDIVKNGVLQTYLYNRSTAKKDGVETTANGTWGAGRISTGYNYIEVKKGRRSFDQLLKKVGNGLFITDVDGLDVGLDTNSGDFSCQAEGYLIQDGKITSPVNLITLSGNVLSLFQNCLGFDNETELLSSGISLGDMAVKHLSVGGE